MTSSDDTFDSNSAVNGGAIFISSTGSNIFGATFKDNTATQFGGAIYIAQMVKFKFLAQHLLEIVQVHLVVQFMLVLKQLQLSLTLV